MALETEEVVYRETKREHCKNQGGKNPLEMKNPVTGLKDKNDKLSKEAE